MSRQTARARRRTDGRRVADDDVEHAVGQARGSDSSDLIYL